MSSFEYTIIGSSPMLYTKFHDNRPTSLGEEDFLRVFTLYGHGSHLGHVTWTPWTNFCSPSHGWSRWNLISISPVVSEEMFENVNGFTIYGHGSYICHVTKLIFIMSPLPKWVGGTYCFWDGSRWCQHWHKPSFPLCNLNILLNIFMVVEL